MKKLQLKYNLLLILYFICNCTIIGYAAVFLKWRGFSNTTIGIVMGISNLLMVITSPKISNLVKTIKGLTLTKLTSIIFISNIICWCLLAFIKMPIPLTMIIFMFMANSQLSVMPLLSMICMNYLKVGEYVNFGSARGLGSLSYATAAVVIGLLVDILNPSVLAIIELIAGTGVIIICKLLPDVNVNEEVKTNTKEITMISFIKKYPQYMYLLLGIMFQYLSGNMLNTYMINIVKNLGGNTSLYGVVTFAMAASELPFMSVAYRLMKKHKINHIFIFSSFMYIFRNF